jgi:uncharacterized protein (DUF849 family)
MDIIEGLVLSVKGSEIVTIAKERSTYHKEKARHYTDRVANMLTEKAGAIRNRTERELSPDDEQDTTNVAFSNTKAETVTDKYERLAKNHVDKSKYFAFVAEHLEPNTMYRLTESDLNKLEIVSSSNHW